MPEAEQVDAILRLLTFLVETFGILGSILLLLGPVLLGMGWVVYNHRRADRELMGLKQVYEARIRELKESDDQWRHLFLSHALGLGEDELREILPPRELPDPGEEPNHS